MTRNQIPQQLQQHNLVVRSRNFAITHGERPSDDVEDVLIEFDHLQAVHRAAAMLLGLIEDSVVTFEQIENEFGKYVADIVAIVASHSYARLRRDWVTIALRLADRIATVRKSIVTGDSKYKMHLEEYPEFRAALFTQTFWTDLLHPMWYELDRLMAYGVDHPGF